MLPWLANRPPSLLGDVRDTSLAKVVRDEVLGLILRGEIAPGERINEPDVAARLRVSRVPVREALRELESSGLVAARKHSGAFVRQLGVKEIADLYETRGVLDGHVGWRAARLPSAQRKELGRKLRELMREMKDGARQRDVQRYYASNLAFHWAFVEVAGNDHLASVYRGIVQQLHLSRLKNLSQDIGMQVSLDEHQHIMAALAEGDAARCQALLLSHVTASHVRLAERLHQDQTPIGDKQ